MPRLTIPEGYRSGIAALGGLSDSLYAALKSAIKKSPSADTSKELADKIGKNTPSITKKDLAKIIFAIVNLQVLLAQSHVTPATLASDVADALARDSPKLAKIANLDTLPTRIEEIVSGPLLQITSVKVQDLATEVERSYCDARILTDVRTAFSDDAKEMPRGMALLHSLRIRYHDDTGSHREFYVTLLSDDLKELKRAIERAEVKAKTLTELLAKADCSLFE